MQNHNFIKIFSVSAIFIFFCAFILSSCAEHIIDIDIYDLDSVIREQIDFTEHDSHGYDEFSAEQIKYTFGITESDTVKIIVRKKVDFYNQFNEEILILAETENKDKAKEIETKLKEYKTQRLKILTDYTVRGSEKQYYLVEASEITVNQRYVFWVVDTRKTEINAIIDKYIRGK